MKVTRRERLAQCSRQVLILVNQYNQRAAMKEKVSGGLSTEPSKKYFKI